jgi:AcrR family transcriptional regulator
MTDKRTKILEAAITLFAADGFWKTSTARIAKEAGVANGTLFNCFENKEKLIDAVYAGLKGELLAVISRGMPAGSDQGGDPGADLETRLFHVWSGVVTWALDNPLRWRLMDQLRVSELVSSETRSAVAEDFKSFHQMIEQGLTDRDLAPLPIDYHMEILIGQVMALISYLQTEDGAKQNRTAIIASGFECYWDGVCFKG